jgi:hypothetical protein
LLSIPACLRFVPRGQQAKAHPKSLARLQRDVGQRWHLSHVDGLRVCGCIWLQKANVDRDTPCAVLLFDCPVELEKQLIGVEFVGGGDLLDFGLGEFGDFLDGVVYGELGFREAPLDGVLDVSVR